MPADGVPRKTTAPVDKLVKEWMQKKKGLENTRQERLKKKQQKDREVRVWLWPISNPRFTPRRSGGGDESVTADTERAAARAGTQWLQLMRDQARERAKTMMADAENLYGGVNPNTGKPSPFA